MTVLVTVIKALGRVISNIVEEGIEASKTQIVEKLTSLRSYYIEASKTQIVEKLTSLRSY